MKTKPKISEDVYEVDLYTDFSLADIIRMREYDHVDKRINTDWFDDNISQWEDEAVLRFLSFREEVPVTEAIKYLKKEEILGAGIRELAALGADCPEIFKSEIQVFSLVGTSVKSRNFEDIVPVLLCCQDYRVFDTRSISDTIPRDAHVLIHAPPGSSW
ncbi:MAG: hypothetical protein WC629_00640 [Candidatus Paceibacterota bacterium]|jgi:hypothetical protein